MTTPEPEPAPAAWVAPGVAPGPAPGAPGVQYPFAAPTKPPVRVWDLVLTILLLVADIVIAGAASVMGMFLVMASDPCGVRECVNELIMIGWLMGMILPWIVLIVVLVLSIVLLVKRRHAFWMPLVGAAGIVLVLFLAFAVTAAGVPGASL